MNTHYSLLGLTPAAAPEEVKRAFRREVARYHPDKVQHLGAEFQEIATARAAALTEAYRTLMDAELRERYDAQLVQREAAAASVPPAPTAHVQPAAAAPVVEEEAPRREGTAATPPARDEGMQELVRRAVLAKLQNAASEWAEASVPQGFDAAYHLKGRRTIFRKTEGDVQLLLKFVPEVNSASVQSVWPAAARVSKTGGTLCLALLGSGIASARELGATVADLRRKTRGTAPLILALDIRDWQALTPPDTPPAVRSLLERLRGDR